MRQQSIWNKSCLTCQRPLTFKARRDETRKNYCSPSCRAKGAACTERFRAAIEKVCLRCVTTFVARTYRQAYCSQNCQGAAAAMRSVLKLNTLETYLSRLAHRSGRALAVSVVIDLWNAQSGKCALTGQPMTHILGAGRQHRNASLDRINSALGYVAGNMQLVCWAANTMKQDFSVAELKRWCEFILKEARHPIENS